MTCPGESPYNPSPDMRISGIGTFVRPAATIALLASILLAGCGGLFNSDDDAGKKNWAVIVGISSYQSSAMNLKWGEEDALDVYDTLRASKGWDMDNVTLLTNS